MTKTTVQLGFIVCLVLVGIFPAVGASQDPNNKGPLFNDPARAEAFMDWGLGMFVHWSHDSKTSCCWMAKMVRITPGS